MSATIASAKFTTQALQGLVSHLAADMSALSVDFHVSAQQTV
jgi:hypothetical protein